jgi:hypothetical protein
VSPPPPKRSMDRPACDFCIVYAHSYLPSPSEPGKQVMALGPGEQMSHSDTGATAWIMARQDLTRSPWQTFRFESDGCIACVGSNSPTLVLTGTAAKFGVVYLHPKCDELMRQGLQQWEPMETRQSLPPTPGELPRTLCQLRLQHHSFYVDFNMADALPIMYPLRDNPNQLLHLEPQTLRILHLSDTHSLHRPGIPDLPAADLLLHTGDFTKDGTDDEYLDFNGWIGYWKNAGRVKHCVAIAGNHEFHYPSNEVVEGRLTPAVVLDPSYVRSRLSNATFLAHEQVVFDGLRIFGSTWEPYSDGGCPDNPGTLPTEQVLWAAYCSSNPPPPHPPSAHKFDRIPAGTHVLMTHGPASGVLDWEGQSHAYGSSAALRQRIIACDVKAHLFGHIHEQRGVFVKNDHGVYVGGVEYRHPQYPHSPFPTPGPPPSSYPCDIISNNAVKNNSRHEAPMKHYIAGPPRMIIAHRQPGPAAAGAACSWRFRLPPLPLPLVGGQSHPFQPPHHPVGQQLGDSPHPAPP